MYDFGVVIRIYGSEANFVVIRIRCLILRNVTVSIWNRESLAESQWSLTPLGVIREFIRYSVELFQNLVVGGSSCFQQKLFERIVIYEAFHGALEVIHLYALPRLLFATYLSVFMVKNRVAVTYFVKLVRRVLAWSEDYDGSFWVL